MQMQIFLTLNAALSICQILCILCLSGVGWGVKPSSTQICPLLSSLKTAGLLLRHQQLDLMSSDLPLRMGSFPAGRRANESPLESYTNSYLQQLGGQFSAHRFS